MSVQEESSLAATLYRASSADVPTLARLAAHTFVETFGHLYRPQDLQAFLATSRSEARYARMLTDPRIAMWLAKLPDAGAIGYAIAGPCKLPVENLEPQAGEIMELYIRSEYHGRQLGTRLLETAIEWLETESFAPLYVGVWSENFGAQRLYQRYGFRKVGEYGFPVGEHVDLEYILRRNS
jgi:ribosomal protein S18 acetylase RimI-like enzyme